MRKVKFPIVKKVEGENVWTTYFKRQVLKKNKCINLIVTGGPGSGKSWSLLTEFCKIDPDFDINDQCFFHPKKLLAYFRSGKITKGKPFMFDEAGVKTGHMNWQDEVTKGLNVFLQTARHRNYIFGMTVPYMNFVAKGVRTMMNCRWITDNHIDNLTIVFPYTMEYNGDLDKFYRKRLFYIENNRLNRCDILKLPKPPKQIRLEYEKIKKEFTDKTYRDIELRIEMQEKKEEVKVDKINLIKCSTFAHEIGIHPHTIRGWINKGLIKARQIGADWFMALEEKERILNDGNLLISLRKSSKSL